MASEVDICNLSLAHLGDDATVSSLDPPEGSAQAEHCARFYPIARDSLLEMHNWGFATRRVALALLSESPPSTWKYAYAVPGDAVNYLGVYAPDAPDDLASSFPLASCYGNSGQPQMAMGSYTPQPFILETDASGQQILLTNQDSAVLRYTRLVTDTTQFSPLFTDTLAWLLASYLAGPVIKGDTGVAAAQACYKTFLIMRAQATVSDANQQRHTPVQSVNWIANR